MPELSALLYRSSALIPERSADERLILDAALSRNARLDVTGYLHREVDLFFQWLEGPPASVDAIFASIERDPRHEGIQVLFHGSVPHRRFQGWAMGYTSRHSISMLDWAADLGLPINSLDQSGIIRFLEHCANLGLGYPPALA